MHTIGPSLEAAAPEPGDSLPRRTHRLFAWLLVGQWVAGALVALALTSSVANSHREAALFLGGALTALPVLLAQQRRLQRRARALEEAGARVLELEEQLARTRKLATLGQMAASLSHELRNPLAAARTALACVQRRVASPLDLPNGQRIHHFLGVIEREMAVCTRIVSDVLDFARERPPELAPCPLRPLVDEALNVVPGRMGVRVLNGVPESMPVPRLDRERFRRILVNLVQNAVEAMPDGREGQVWVHAEGGQTAPWRIRVVDDGPGIPEAVLPRIFEPLFTTKVQGTGLGLAIVHALVRKHGGTLTVHSEVGRGTEFVIELPAEQA